MKTIELAKASRSLAEYADESESETLIVTRGKKPIAALVPLRNVDRESLALSTNPAFMDIIEAARAEVRAGKTLTLEQMTE